MSEADRFLVVAHLGAFARAVCRAGAPSGVRVGSVRRRRHRPLCAAQRGGAAARRRGAGFDRQDLLLRAARLCPPSRCLGLGLRAGFEDDTETLALLARGRELLGNPPELVARLKDPAEFFGLLDRLGIAHPPTVLARPERRRGWLFQAARRDRGLSRGRRLVGGLRFGRAGRIFPAPRSGSEPVAAVSGQWPAPPR